MIEISDDETAGTSDKSAKDNEGSAMSKEVNVPTSSNVGMASDKAWQKFPGPAGIVRRDITEQTLAQALQETAIKLYVDQVRIFPPWHLGLHENRVIKPEHISEQVMEVDVVQ